MKEIVAKKSSTPALAPDPVDALAASDGVIAFSTDTVYGLGARLDRPAALARIFALKGRDERKPLTLLGASAESFEPYIQPPPAQARRLMADHWPGALSLVFDKTDLTPDAVTRGEPTVSCRVADCESLRALLRRLPGGVLATTSANVSGKPPCLTAKSVRDAFGDALPVWGDDAEIATAQPSTVARVYADGAIEILRPGPVALTSG